MAWRDAGVMTLPEAALASYLQRDPSDGSLAFQNHLSFPSTICIGEFLQNDYVSPC